MKPLLSILLLFLGMAAVGVASPEQFTFAPLPEDSGNGSNAPAQAVILTNTPPLTNLVVVDQAIQNLPPPTNLPPTAAPVQSAPAPVPGQAVDWPGEPNLPQFKPSPHVAPVRIDNAPIENDTVTTNSLPPDSMPAVQTSQPEQTAVPVSSPTSTPPPAVSTPPESTPVVSATPPALPVAAASAEVPPAKPKAKKKREEFVFEPLPDAPPAHPDLTVHYEAVKDIIAPPAPMPEQEPAQPAPAPEKKSSPVNAGAKLIVSPAHEVYGTVASVDPHGRFAVLNFPLGRMPAVGDVLPVFRHGVNVGQVKVTGPQRDDNTAADVVSGDLQVDDDVRD